MGRRRRDHRAAIVDRNPIPAVRQDLLEDVAAAIRRQTDVQVLPVSADLSSLEGVRTFADQAVARFASVDILINNAGAIRAGSILAKPDEDWLIDWSLKVFGYMRLACSKIRSIVSW